jgi:tripartite-type tricarboxylate transporter receptor subunit TctC
VKTIQMRHLAVTGLAMAAALASPAHAAYPDRAITLVVPFAAGGPTDIAARIISVAFQRSMGQSIIVENRGGAGGNIGMQMVARAEPDGYTLLLTSTAIAVNPALSRNLGYDPIKDFSPVSELVNQPNIIVVNTKAGITSIADLVAKAKAAPGKFNYSSPGVGTKSHLAGEQFKLRAEIDLAHVPYRGAGPAALALLEGSVQAGSVGLSAAEALVRDGQLKALAVTGEKRWFSLPDVPTMIESGYPGFVSDTFSALLAPAKTPQDIIDRLVKEAQAAMRTDEAKQQAARAGFQIVAGTPAELARKIAEEIPAVKELVARIGIKPE